MNRYSYTQNDPVNFVDPSGLDDEETYYVYQRIPPLPWGDGGPGGSTGSALLQDIGPGDHLLGGGLGGSIGGGDHITLSPDVPNYDKCANINPGIPRNVIGWILAASKAAGTSPTLLAFTWLKETAYGLSPLSNPNNGEPGNQDVGPMQINYNTWVNTPQVELGGGARAVFGSVNGNTMISRIWDGDTFSNLIAGAAILRSHGSGRTAAGRYRTGTGPYSKKPSGIAEFKKRAEAYDQWASKFDAFFNCLRKG